MHYHRTNYTKHSLSVKGVDVRNNLDVSLTKLLTSLSIFKKNSKIHFMNNSQYNLVNLYFKLEIHACNNPSPVLKRCILSAVASTSSQGGGRLDRGGGVVCDQNVSRCTKIFQDI